MTELNWTELNWTELWTFRLVELELWTLNFLNWTARMCELLLWTPESRLVIVLVQEISLWTQNKRNVVNKTTGAALNYELLIEKHVKVIFCGEENVKEWFGGFFRAISPGLLGPNTKSRKWISICEIWNWREKTLNWSRKSLIFLNWSYF